MILVGMLFAYGGLGLMKAAWDRRMPTGIVLWGKNEAGKPMRREQRLLFYCGGFFLLFLGLGAIERL